MCSRYKQAVSDFFDAGEATIIGTRDEQQDSKLLVIEGDCLLAAVCDGMGGLKNGARASSVAIETLRGLYSEKIPGQSFADFYINAVDILDESVYALRRLSAEPIPSGTTIVSVGIERNALHWLSVGDSRLYLIRGQEIVCATVDHNYYLKLRRAYENGEITQDVYLREKHKGEALVSYVGMGGVELMDVSTKPLITNCGDVIILASDGLYRCVTTAEMLTVVQTHKSAQSVADRLIDLAQQHANKELDNTTVIVIKVVRGENDETGKMQQ